MPWEGIFTKTNAQQHLFGMVTQLSEGLQTRFRTSWAQLFKVEIVPILFDSEDKLSILYGKTGRLNISVGRVLSLCFL